jgi:hypothetical protein
MEPEPIDLEHPRDPLYRTRVFAFLDIIGFEAEVERLDKDPDRFPRLWNALHAGHDLRISWLKPVEISAFSDSIVVSGGLDDMWSVAIHIARLQLDLLILGLLSRGGISQGPGYHQNGIVFGRGMLTAYRLETHAAFYPRVVVADPYLRAHLWNDGESGHRLLAEDSEGDGLSYVDFLRFPEWQGKAAHARPKDFALWRDSINEGLEKADPFHPGRRAKWIWLAKRVNRLREEYGLTDPPSITW